MVLLVPGATVVFQSNATLVDEIGKLESESIIRDQQYFGRSINRIWNEKTPLKSFLLELNGKFNYRYLRSSVKPNKVVIGKDGWMFLSDEEVLKHYTPQGELNESSLNHLQVFLQERKSYFDSIGIPYFVVIAPNKHSIYPEQLPDWSKGFYFDKRTDQILDVLDSLKVGRLDLRPVLMEYKSEGLYHSTDTHWNDQGAFRAYQEIQKFLESVLLDSYDAQNFVMSRKDSIIEGGDLARMIGLDKGMKIPVQKLRFTGDTKVEDKNDLNILIFRDSFTSALKPYFKREFLETNFIWNHTLDRSIVEKEKPDLVLHIIIERYAFALGNRDQ